MNAGSRRRLAFIAVFLGVQVALAASYYLGSDPYDERFAWRMFSSVRLQSCQVAVVANKGGVWSPIALDSVLHPAWQALVRRNRTVVAQKAADMLCRRRDLDSVAMTVVCQSVRGQRLPPRRLQQDCHSVRRQRSGWTE